MVLNRGVQSFMRRLLLYGLPLSTDNISYWVFVNGVGKIHRATKLKSDEANFDLAK